MQDLVDAIAAGFAIHLMDRAVDLERHSLHVEGQEAVTMLEEARFLRQIAGDLMGDGE